MFDYMDGAGKEHNGPGTFCCARKQSAQKMMGGGIPKGHRGQSEEAPHKPDRIERKYYSNISVTFLPKMHNLNPLKKKYQANPNLGAM